MKSISVTCDIQPIVNPQKTGIGWVAYELLRQLEKNPSIQIIAQAFVKTPALRKSFADKCSPNWIADPCTWVRSETYKSLWPFIPLPYRWFFKRSGDVQVFFSNHVPPGAKGKIVSIVHDMSMKAYPETMNWKTKYLLMLTLQKSCNRADRIVTVSEFSKAEIVKWLGLEPEKIVVMPNGVDFKKFNPHHAKDSIATVVQKYGIPQEYILYLGTLEPRKNIPRLVEAYAIAKSKNPSLPKLVIAGRKGWLFDEIFERVRNLDLEDHVVFTGYVKDEDVPLVLAGAKFFIFPSVYEGFGMPPLEAMASGTPVAVANTASLPEVVGDAGIFFSPFDAEEMASVMNMLDNNGSLRQMLAQKGLNRASAFTWERAGTIFSQVCHDVVEN